MFFGDIQILANSEFIDTFLKGAPRYYHKNILHTIASPNVNLIKPDGFNTWLPDKEYWVYSKNYVRIQKWSKIAVAYEWQWRKGELIERQIRLAAKKGISETTGQEVVEISDMVVLPGPLVSPQYQKIGRIITSEPSLQYGDTKTWTLLTFNLDGVHERGTETFIRNHYYNAAGDDYKQLTLKVLPSMINIALTDESYHGLREGESGILRMSDFVVKGEYQRKDIHSAWYYKETTPYKLEFNAMKYKDPNTQNPVVVLTGINSITVKPNMPEMNNPTPIVRD
jgi:hypothetical protein